MKAEDIITLMGDTKNALDKAGDLRIYAILCNKKTWDKIALYIRTLSPFRELDKTLPFFLCFDSIHIHINNFLEDDTALFVDKNMFESIMMSM